MSYFHILKIGNKFNAFLFGADTKRIVYQWKCHVGLYAYVPTDKTVTESAVQLDDNGMLKPIIKFW